MVIFHSYVSLPEGTVVTVTKSCTTDGCCPVPGMGYPGSAWHQHVDPLDGIGHLLGVTGAMAWYRYVCI